MDSVRECITVKGNLPNCRDVYGNTPLYYAALHGHREMIKVLINEFACNVNIKGEYENSLVHAACWNGHFDCVRMLVTEFGCDPMERNVHNDSPVHIAAQFGHESIIKLLVGEFNCSTSTRGQYGWTPLHFACKGGHTNVVCQLILEMQCEQSAKDEDGDAPIHIAALHGREHVIKLLVEEFGCNAGEKSAYGRTPLHLACEGGYAIVVRQLIFEMECEQSAKDEDGDAPIHIAALHGQKHVIKLLVEEFGCNAGEKGSYGRTPLHFACQGGHANIVRLLILKMQCERSGKDEHGNAPIHIAALHGQMHVIKLLVEEFGCNAGEKGSYGRTPLHFACQGGHANIVRLLILKMQCEQSGKDEHGNAPIHIAALYGQVHVIKLLVEEFGCNTEENGEYGRTPLHFACEEGHANVVCQLIFKMQCERSAKDEHGNAPIHIAALYGKEHIIKILVEEFGCNAEEKGQYGRTPLHFACQGGHLNVVHSLITDFHIEIMSIDERGRTPFDIAVLYGHTDIVKEFVGYICIDGSSFESNLLGYACIQRNWDLFRLLIVEFKCDPTMYIKIALDSFGSTPLHIACRNDDLDLVHTLITEFHVDTEIVDEVGDTPLKIAVMSENIGIVKEFVGHFHIGKQSVEAKQFLKHTCERENVDLLRILLQSFECDTNVGGWGGTALETAVSIGNVDVIKEFIGHVNIDDLSGAFCQACAIGHLGVVRMLISDFGCDVMTEDEEGMTGLEHAVKNNHAKVINELVGHIDLHNPRLHTLLHFSMFADGVTDATIKLLLQLGVNLISRDEDGFLPIHVATRQGRINIVSTLINVFNCDPAMRGPNGITPLHEACSSGNLDLVRLLITDMKYDLCCQDDDGNTPLHLAARCSTDTTSIIRELAQWNGALLKCLNNKRQSPLHIACGNDDLDLVHTLITEFHVDTEIVDEVGDTPLKIAVMSENIGIVKEFVGHVHIGKQSVEAKQFLKHACERGNIELLRILLLSFGCDPNLLNESNITSPLHIACENDDMDLVHTLITEFHVDTEIVDEVGDTPLTIAVMSENIGIVKEFVGHVHIGKQSVEARQFLEHACEGGNVNLLRILLLSFGCDPNLLNEWPSPLHIACENEAVDLVHALISEFGVDTSVWLDEGGTALETAVRTGNVDVIKEFIGHVNIENHPSAFYDACIGGYLEVVRMLISEFGCDVMAEDEVEGLTGLEGAILSNCSEVIKELLGHVDLCNHRFHTLLHFSIRIRSTSDVTLELLLQHGVNLTSRDQDGYLPIHVAAQQGRINIVSTLVNDFNCDPAVRGPRGITPLHEACSSGNLDLVRLLIMDMKCDSCCQDDDGNTPMHFAACSPTDTTPVIRELAQQNGALLECLNNKRKTPLHLAAGEGWRSENIKILSELGCSHIATDIDGNTPLHLAAMAGSLHRVKELTELCAVPLDFWNNNHQLPIHLALERKRNDIVNVFLLHTDGNTPLHIATIHDEPERLRLLIQLNGSPHCLNSKKQTPLHLAAAKGNETIVKMLLSEYSCSPTVTDTYGNTPLHMAALSGRPAVLKELAKQYGSPPDCQNSNQQTPLHLAIAGGHLEMVSMLVSEFYCNVSIADVDGNTPLHLAAKRGWTVILKELAKQYGSPPDCQNNNQQTPLQLAIGGGRLKVAFMLVSEFHCNVNSADIDGNTILHLAVRNENADIDIVISLLSEHKVSTNSRNSSGHTPLYYATLNRNARIVSELVKYNCNPAAFDEDYRTLEEISQEKLSGGSLTKVFVIGNKCAGKSTLIEALKNETQQNTCLTENVIPHTAGIIPSVHCSEQYGRVLFYDFAGDPEYYSSHAAALERLLTSSCHIFLLVEDFSAEEEAILQTLGYWLTFISYNSKDLQTKSQVIIVGSHADITESRGENSERKVCKLFTEISSKFVEFYPYIEMVGYCSLDCRKSQSTGTEKLYSLLKHCCFSYSAEDRPLSVGAVLLLGVLQRDFKGVIACEVSQICRHIELTKIYLPQGVVTVYSYLQELNAQGVILILGSRDGLSKEWVVLDVSSFLATVHKNLFSCTSLSHVCSTRSLSNLGLISESNLENVLDKFDVKLLKQCLKYLQYCIELDDSEILQKIFSTTANETNATKSCSILGPSEDSSENTSENVSSDNASENDSSENTANSGSSLLFFPALLKGIQRSSMNWFSKESYTSCKGWYIECSREYDYFPPRFLHVLLLRLAFKFTLPPCSTRKEKNLDISRRCVMWKSGIHWLMKTDVECVVEVVKQSRVIVMIKSERDCDADCTRTFLEIVGKVLEAKQEFCHSLIAKKYLIHPDDMSQVFIPSFKDLHLFDMKEVKEALKENQKAVLSTDGQSTLPLHCLQMFTMWSKLLLGV